MTQSDMDQFINDAKAMFARYGFMATPLEDGEIAACFWSEFDLDQVYSIGCDVYAGFKFVDCWIDGGAK